MSFFTQKEREREKRGGGGGGGKQGLRSCESARLPPMRRLPGFDSNSESYVSGVCC